MSENGQCVELLKTVSTQGVFVVYVPHHRKLNITADFILSHVPMHRIHWFGVCDGSYHPHKNNIIVYNLEQFPVWLKTLEESISLFIAPRIIVLKRKEKLWEMITPYCMNGAIIIGLTDTIKVMENNPQWNEKLKARYVENSKNVKVWNQHVGGLLWHYGHFIHSCFIPEYYLLKSCPKIENVYRCSDEKQRIGIFSPLWCEFIKKETFEIPKNEYLDMCVRYLSVEEYGQGPYPSQYFDKIYADAVRKYNLKNPQRYIIVIYRTHQDLHMSKKVSKKFNYTNGAERRNLDNYEEIYDRIRTFYPKRTKLVYLEDKTMEEQVRLFYHADIIITVHGAGLCNMIWMRPYTKVIEVEPICGPTFKHMGESKKIKMERCENNIDSVFQTFIKIAK